MNFFYRILPISAVWLAAFAARAEAPASADELTRFDAHAPVSDFSLPMFGEDGYKTWALSGKRGRYVDATRIDIEGLRLRLFSGDARARVDVTIESPAAIVNPEAATAGGDDFLYVHGPGYAVTGRGWRWDDRAKSLKILKDVQVTFSGEGKGGEPIGVTADTLDILTEKDAYYFRFAGAVRVVNGNAEMRTPQLDAWSNREERGGERLRKVRRILADKGVVVTQEGRRLTARRAELPESGDGREIVLTGDPVMRDDLNDATLRGAEVRLWRDANRAEVLPEKDGRVHASLPPSRKGDDRRMEITSSRLEVNRAADGARLMRFLGDAKVDDPAFAVACDDLTARFVGGTAADAPTRVDLITALGHVVIDQPPRRAFAPEARIFPEKGEAELGGNPVVADSDSGSILEGARMVLTKATGNVVVFGSDAKPARVLLAPIAGTDAKTPTEIFSDSIRMTRGRTDDLITFLDNVRVQSGALTLSCGALDVFVARSEEKNAPMTAANVDGEGVSFGKILRIEGRDRVRYAQEDMRGEAARLEIFPSAMVKDDDADAPEPKRFVALFGDPSEKLGPARPTVYLPHFAADGAAGDGVPTRVTSDTQELFTRPDGSRFYFRGDVEMRGEDFTMQCDNVEVVSETPAADGARRVGRPERVRADGNIVMKQGSRTATGGTAEVSLRTGKCVLGDTPVVRDEADGTRVDGWRITLLRGQKRVFVEGAPPADAADSGESVRRRPTVVLPPFGDMGFDSIPKTQDK